MKLYTNRKGDWAGTQIDAKNWGGYICVDVPTIKPELLNFLNLYNVKESVHEPIGTVAPTRQPIAPRMSNNDYNSVRTYLETCDAQELNRCLTIVCSRLHDFLD